MFRISYGHTSHGSQIVTGMDLLKGAPGSLYWFDHNGTDDGLSLHDGEPAGDLGHNGSLVWEQSTRALLDTPGCDRNMIMWSWCGGVSHNTEEGINIYLNAMNQLELDYPHVTFVYMTGHLDGTGEDGNLNIRNNQIRDYCTANNKILFDFADIENYDPDGNCFLNLAANDQCDYWLDGVQHNWADEWCDAHPGECESCSCAHSRCLNCQLKGRAFWWMMARVAGWGACLPAPTDLTATADPENQQIFLTWTDNSGDTNEDSFIIQRQVNGGVWDNNYATVAADSTSYTDTGLDAGTYTYRVIAHLNDDSSGNPCDSSPSNVASAVISYDVPSAPSDLDSELSGSDITLSWTDNSENEESFILKRKVGTGNFSVLSTLPAGTESHIDSSLPPLHTYTYRVKARNSVGDSEYSNETSQYVAEGSYIITLKQGVDGYTGCRDAYLDYDDPDGNYGGTPYKHVLNDPKCNFVISFDLPSEVMAKKILEAKIVFYCWSVSNWQPDQYLDLYRIIEDWDEGSATWNERSSGNKWTTAGGTFDASPLGYSLIPSHSYYPEIDITDLVQQWADGGQENYGVILVNDTAVDTGIKASEYSEYGRPYLEITYTSKRRLGDFDGDGDVDGSDLAVFASDFGRTDCDSGSECEGNFDYDNDVDEADLATFAAAFGRTACPH